MQETWILWYQIEYSDLIEYSSNCGKISWGLWQYSKYPSDNITDSESFKFNTKITGRTSAAGNTKNVEIAVSLKDFSNFWRILEIPMVICEINRMFAWLVKCAITSSTGAGIFAITDTKLYIPVHYSVNSG